MPQRKDGKMIILEEEELISLVVLSSQETDDSKERLISSVSAYFFSREKSRAKIIVISLVLGLPNKPSSPLADRPEGKTDELALSDIRESCIAPRAKLRNKGGQRFLIR